MNVITRRIGAAVGGLALASTAVVAGAGTAAADSFSFDFVRLSGSGSGVITVTNRDWSEPAGYAEWQQDPRGSFPGDALTARDLLADGYGIVAHLSTGRTASTRGHDSPYSVTVTGDLPEDREYSIKACVVKGSFETCSRWYGVVS